MTAIARPIKFKDCQNIKHNFKDIEKLEKFVTKQKAYHCINCKIQAMIFNYNSYMEDKILHYPSL